MKCFVHSDRDAVATCNSCGRGLCHECAVEVSSGLACRNRCEDRVRRLKSLIERNIDNAPTTFFLIRSARRTHLYSAVFTGTMGLCFLWFAYSEYQKRGEVGFLFAIGAASFGYGIMTFLRFLRRGRDVPGRIGHCSQCDYDLTGNTTGRCPECGMRTPSP